MKVKNEQKAGNKNFHLKQIFNNFSKKKLYFLRSFESANLKKDFTRLRATYDLSKLSRT
jgi:hypothetical protein